MVIIIAKLQLEREKIQNEMPLLLEQVSLSSRILMDILEFHSKSRLHFGLLSSAYLLAQRLNVLELQVNYLKCPYDVQNKNKLLCSRKIVQQLVCSMHPLLS